jgi:hypothetical protein
MVKSPPKGGVKGVTQPPLPCTMIITNRSSRHPPENDVSIGRKGFTNVGNLLLRKCYVGSAY